jgi:hypothetical protein
LTAPRARYDHGHDLAKPLVAHGCRQIEGPARAVVGAEVQTDAHTIDLNLAPGLQLRHHVTQMVIQVMRIIGQGGGAVRWTAVGNDQQQAPTVAAGALSRCWLMNLLGAGTDASFSNWLNEPIPSKR